MHHQSKAVGFTIGFDIDEANMAILQEALPDLVFDVVKGATAAFLTRNWNPGTVHLFVVQARKDVTEMLELCRFLVSSDVLARNSQNATDTEESLPKTLGLHRSRQHRGRRPPSPLLVLVSPEQRDIVSDVLRAGAHSCLILPINPKDVASMLDHARTGNQPGRHTLSLERAQTEDRWRDNGGQG